MKKILLGLALSLNSFICLSTSLEIRFGNELSKTETQIIEKRLNLAKETLKIKDGQPIPKIAIVGSGGGVRALISNLGFTSGLEELGLLNACSYYAALSGSTWFLTSWIAHGFSLKNLKIFLRNQLARDVNFKDCNLEAIHNTLYEKRKANQDVTFTDFYGALLANLFFNGLPKNGQGIYLSQFKSKLEKGSYPFPLFTAVLNDSSPYKWFEFLCNETGSTYFNAWVPIEYFGRKFDNGKMVDTYYEETLGYLIGLFSSAYALSFADIISFIKEKFEEIIQEKVENKNIKYLNPIASIVFNYVKNLNQCPYHSHNYIELKDAGYAFNLPFPPLMRRDINLYLVCDDSAGMQYVEDNTMHWVEDYAKTNGYKFPKIDYTNINKKTVSLFYDEQDPTVPIVLYFPNQVPFPTIKFAYTFNEFNSLHNYMEQAVISSKEVIDNAIEISIKNLNSLKETELKK